VWRRELLLVAFKRVFQVVFLGNDVSVMMEPER